MRILDVIFTFIDCSKYSKNIFEKKKETQANRVNIESKTFDYLNK